MPILDLDIAADADDAMWVGGSEPPTDERLTYSGGDRHLYVSGLTEAEHERIGLRFALPIPPGATITAASLRVNRTSGKSGLTGGPDVKVYASDSVAAFDAAHAHSPAGHDAGGFSATVVQWRTGWDTNGLKTSPDLSALVQEVIDRPGWVNGNYIGFVLDAGNLGGNWAGIDDVSMAGGTPARLHVEYTEGGGGTPQALAGTIAAVSGVSAALRVAKPLAGAVAGASSLAAGLRVAKPLGGAIAGASAMTGALRVSKPLAGTVAGVSALTAALRVAKPLAGTIAGVSSLTAALQVGAGAPVAAAAFRPVFRGRRR